VKLAALCLARCIAVTHLSFAWWFQPASAIQRAAIGLDALAVLLWGVLALRSETVRALYNQTASAMTPRQLQQALTDCPLAFATPARQCVDLVQHIYREFTEAASRRELDALLANIAQLAHAHRTLHLRAQRFGTPEQRTAMAAMLRKHVVSIGNSLQALQAFSGHLTLLSASVATDERATQELHFINQGLQEVLQEFHDAHR
jgi:hypothetical protein